MIRQWLTFGIGLYRIGVYLCCRLSYFDGHALIDQCLVGLA